MIIKTLNAIPKELISEIRTLCGQQLDNHKEYFGSYNRMGSTVKLGSDPLKELDKKVSAFISEFTKEIVIPQYKPFYGTSDSGYEFHRYNPGDQCLVHSDGELCLSEDKKSSLIRYASVVLHLNTVEEGGLTVFPHQNESIKTIEGQVVVFPPYGTHPHYVTPSKETREVLVTWLVYSDINAIYV